MGNKVVLTEDVNVDPAASGITVHVAKRHVRGTH